MNNNDTLTGHKVLVTRPIFQAEFFCRKIEQFGGIAIRFPTIEICPVENPSLISNQLNHLEGFEYAIFISSNAVEQAFKLLGADKFPKSLQYIAIGKKTARTLTQHGRPVVITPEMGYTSEALLAQPEMQLMQNKNVIIFRGEGGRELLAKTLRKRGAVVKYAEVYRRCLPEYTGDQLKVIAKRNTISVITITSAESLINLATFLSRIDGNYLRGLPLILGSDRMLETARLLGFKAPPVVAKNPSDEAMLQALLGWAKTIGT